jgi:GH15 family glucan-1,4-alpha-glucosidase
MASRIEDYALIGDTHTAALVSREGSIDWLCFPRFDSGACFAALLGKPEHGRWLLTPADDIRQIRRRYRPKTLVLETEFVTDTGTVAILDCMPPRSREPDVVRIVEGRRGTVAMRMELIMRFDYGWIVPWVRRTHDGLVAVAGPEALSLHTPVELRGENFTTVSEFTVAEGQEVPFVLAWHRSHELPPIAHNKHAVRGIKCAVKAQQALEETEQWWRKWSEGCKYRGEWRDEVLRSLITLKGLTYAPTGGIVAAPTTSLPEQIGGVRNWDYRYCWVRDATFTLYALALGGYVKEAKAWREWLLRAVAGRPSELQIMYGPAGERRLTELQLDWLPGYERSIPVRTGNAAAAQFQLDVYGEVMDALHQARRTGLKVEDESWHLQRALMEFLESAWSQPDEGIWEVRGPRRHFTHSKVMAWVAFDRAVRAVERFRLDGPLDRWRQQRDQIHQEVCRNGFNPDMGTFVQYYGSKGLDASLLMIPLVGFLPATDPRVLGTLNAVERHLMADGFVQRYATSEAVDGLPPGEGAFLACSFWLADNLALVGRYADARRLFEKLLGLCNDVGLLSEEYDPKAGRLLGNFPQAFSHVGLVNTAYNLSRAGGPAKARPKS